MRRLNAIARMTLGLVSLTIALVLVFDLAFGLIPSETDTVRKVRQRVSENLAVQVATLLQSRDPAAVSATMNAVRTRDSEIESVALRRLDGAIVAASGDHGRHWSAPAGQESTTTHVLVPIQADGKRWGSLEIAYRSIWDRSLADWLSGGMVKLLIALTVAGWLVYYLYLRRVLQHLDPTSAVPERVRMAFDTLTEGVLIIDAQGRIVLTNAALRNLGDGSGEELIGRRPEDIAWLVAALRDDEETFPWTTAMRTRQPVRGRPLSIEGEGRVPRKAIINCAPVIDPSGAARGCMITFNDVTQLEQAHEQLLDALADLASSKEQLEVRNGELQRLASRDPLTGCLNRRSFFDSFERMMRDARLRRLELACIICDIDSFKLINDKYGHAVGDQVIAQLGGILSASVRQADLVCRYGGEEFCVVLPGMNAATAIEYAERLRVKIEAECAASIPALFGTVVTASFGVSTLARGAESGGALVDQADQGLYAAKRAGRNRVFDFAQVRQARETHAVALDAD